MKKLFKERLGYLIAAIAWVGSTVALWVWLLYPIAITEFPAGGTPITTFGAFWATISIIMGTLWVGGLGVLEKDYKGGRNERDN